MHIVQLLLSKINIELIFKINMAIYLSSDSYSKIEIISD